ncbi:hypothetical protein HYV50_02250 [Candidatus Pacearchaeota archaeon]|nr:hypothetical protein [Candidatus Pacearchaeota archaeon]
MIKSKRGSAWIWILIILIILVVAGIVSYFLFSGSEGGGIFGVSSIPQPPALPE